MKLDPEFCPYLDPDPGLCCYQFKKSTFLKAKILSLQNFSYKSYKKSNGNGSNFLSVDSLNGEFLSSFLHLLPLIYDIFTCVDLLDSDPYSKYKSPKLWNRIRIQIGSGSATLVYELYD